MSPEVPLSIFWWYFTCLVGLGGFGGFFFFFFFGLPVGVGHFGVLFVPDPDLFFERAIS